MGLHMFGYCGTLTWVQFAYPANQTITDAMQVHVTSSISADCHNTIRPSDHPSPCTHGPLPSLLAARDTESGCVSLRKPQYPTTRSFSRTLTLTLSHTLFLYLSLFTHTRHRHHHLPKRLVLGRCRCRSSTSCLASRLSASCSLRTPARTRPMPQLPRRARRASKRAPQTHARA